MGSTVRKKAKETEVGVKRGRSFEGLQDTSHTPREWDDRLPYDVVDGERGISSPKVVGDEQNEVLEPLTERGRTGMPPVYIRAIDVPAPRSTCHYPRVSMISGLRSDESGSRCGSRGVPSPGTERELRHVPRLIKSCTRTSSV